MALKAKKSLSALFRFAMRNAAKTAEAEAKAIAGDLVTSETGLGNVSASLISPIGPFSKLGLFFRNYARIEKSLLWNSVIEFSAGPSLIA